MQSPSNYSVFSPRGVFDALFRSRPPGKPVAVDRAAECAPEAAGLTRRGVEAIWKQVEALYATGLMPAITISLRRNGRVFLQRSIGHAHGFQPHEDLSKVPLARPDTPICLFSASKAITALLVHKAVEEGLLRLDERVAHYLPAFAAHGKGAVTVRHLLAHRGGIPTIPVEHVDPSLLTRWDEVVAMLCAAEPFDQTFEKQAYHAITGGYILGELVQRTSGLSLHEALRQWLAEPLGCKHLSFGLPKEHRDAAAPNFHTGPRSVWPVTALSKRVLGASFEEVTAISNSDAFLDSVIPAGNVFASADDTGRVYEMLLRGGTFEGRQVLKPETVEEAIRPTSRLRFDAMLLVPIRFSAGFILGEKPIGLYGPDCQHAYGHLGFLHILSWADPQRDLAASILTSGKTLAPSAFTRTAFLLNAINRECKTVPEFKRLR